MDLDEAGELRSRAQIGAVAALVAVTRGETSSIAGPGIFVEDRGREAARHYKSP